MVCFATRCHVFAIITQTFCSNLKSVFFMWISFKNNIKIWKKIPCGPDDRNCQHMMIHMDIGHPGAKFSGHMNSSMIEQWNFLEPLCIPTILFLNFPFPKQIGIKACVICQHLSVFCWIYIYLPESSHVFNWLGFSQILPKIGRVRSVLLQSVQKIYFDKAMH